jgi:membrane protease YdiL (CAAX protease family)
MTNAQATNLSARTWSGRLLAHPAIRIVVAILFVAIPFAIVATPFNVFVADKSWKRAGAVILTAVIVAAYCGYVRLIEKRAVAEFSRAGAAREFGFGLLLGALLFCVTIGFLAAIGVYQVTGKNSWTLMFATVPGFILGAVLEEVIARGIIFRILEESLGSWIALAISAAIFGLLHLLNAGATLLKAGAISIEAAILLAAAFMVTRRLWFCIGIHFAWNFTQGGIFSGAVSGGQQKGLLRAKVVGAERITGGAFGVEASVVALVVCAAAGMLLLITAKRKGHIVQPFWAR